jgi:hypothetical protein
VKIRYSRIDRRNAAGAAARSQPIVMTFAAIGTKDLVFLIDALASLLHERRLPACQ